MLGALLNKQIRLMSGMMVSMATGMVTGVVGGTIIAIYHSGDLFQSTVWGILVGILIGFITGLPFGILAVSDGVLSGLMGGMMGAMLGEMIPSETIEQLLKILFILFIGVHLLMIYLLLSEMKEKETNMMVKLVKNPLFSGGFLICSVYLLNFTGPIMAKDIGNEQHQHSQETVPEENISNSLALEIKAIDFRYEPRNLSINRGEEYEITLKNDGKDEHDINIVSRDEFYKNNAENFQGEGNFLLHAKAGESASAKISSLPAGNYIFYCTIPGHKEAGMIGEIKVI
ncbi:cupredoxin domain-containing protein [Peribacillus frigoritolerans]|uniref:cupredoxin domain-containing protein n=1 Tax=Peribacillus frigoritolerans TaxID=450367 RepID=UPI002079D8D6|nr:cupredoxin domain-containing protein [Peribacillus frigoritolerans]USK67023.1 cupredoxin domain-containing protein [Peribacillus frigoritolerans]